MAFLADCIVFDKAYYTIFGDENAFFVSKKIRTFGCGYAAMGLLCLNF